MMLMGDTCTRGCRFCHVKTGNPKGKLDPKEPEKVASVVADLGLTYLVLTSVDRDDLPDGGADHFAKTVEALKVQCPETLVEVLIPDFKGDGEAIARIVESGADVIAHNIETVRSLTPKVRDRRASYDQSLEVLAQVKKLDPGRTTKSSLMLGLGELPEEIESCLGDLREIGVDIVTLGQYLQPSPKHLPVVEYLHPTVFQSYEMRARELGFLYVASGPLVRSSYRAGELFLEGLLRRGQNS